MDVGQAITYIFDDPEWIKKVAIGGLLLLVPIFGWLVVAGYGLRIMRRVYQQNDHPLPEWDDFGGDFMLGLKGAVAALIWALPMLILSFAFLCIFIGFAILDEANGQGAPLAGIFAIAGAFGFQIFAFIFQIAYSFMIPLVLSRVAVTDSLNSAFEFGDILQEARRIPVPLLIAVLLQLGLNSVAGFGVFLCVIGVLFTWFLAYIMLSHVYGQIRRLADAEPPPVVTATPTTT